MDNFAKAIAAIKEMRADGVISEYAVGGAMAMVFWSEPTATYDLDVFVSMEQSAPLVSLEPIYRRTRNHGFVEDKETHPHRQSAGPTDPGAQRSCG